MPAEAFMDVLSGDPEAEGSEFVIRYRTTGVIHVPPHWHPGEERITVVAGVFRLGLADRFDESVLREYGAGMEVMVPARVIHFSGYGDGTVIEVRGVGPFRTFEVTPQG